jgi:hypothetical protein
MIRADQPKRAQHGAQEALSELHFSLRLFLPLYQSDEDIAQLVLGSEARLWPQIVRHLERDGLPQPRALFGRLRYLPAVLRYFDRREGLLPADATLLAEDGPERFSP